MSDIIEVKVPDIGDYKDVPVIEVFVKPGDTVNAEESLITVESDKATMEVPSPATGTVKELRVKVGDTVSERSLVLLLEAYGGTAPQKGAETQRAPAAQQPAATQAASPPPPPRAQQPAAQKPAAETSPQARTPQEPERSTRAVSDEDGFGKAHASPSVRRLAREFGVDLAQLKGSGPKERILKEDVQAYVKNALAQPRAAGAGGVGLNLAPMPEVDFSRFGPVQTQPLSRIKKLAGSFLHRNWVTIPHVTQHDE